MADFIEGDYWDIPLTYIIENGKKKERAKVEHGSKKYICTYKQVEEDYYELISVKRVTNR